MNPWHDIRKERVSKESFWALIEISKGSKNKYELDKETGRLKLDRVLFTSTHYPQNYGLIPLTYADDFDPLDVLVLCSEDILPMSFVECVPIGVLNMIDNGLNDEKIIAVAKSDPFYSAYKDINEIPPHIMDEIKHFFSVYKTLEGKPTSVDIFEDSVKAKEIIGKCMERYNQVILPKLYEERKHR